MRSAPIVGRAPRYSAISVAMWTLPRGGADIKRISKRQLERWGFRDSYDVLGLGTALMVEVIFR